MRPKRVLLIDDDVELLGELSDVLEGGGLDVLVADSGAAATTIAEANTYDVAVVDIKLPDVDGIQLIGTLREIRPDAAYIIITAFATLERAIESLRSDIFDFLSKPIHPDDFMDTVKRALAVRMDVASEKERMQNIEKLNQICMGREVKVLELRREINRLLIQLGEKPKYKI